jgi:predicted dehydrogenase
MAIAMTPFRIGIARLTHGHVNWLLRQADREDIQIVGVYEPDADVAQRYVARYGFLADLIVSDLDVMLDRAQPEAVTAFGSIFEHLEVVAACAPRGIHVMVEKPLAISYDHARQMADLAQQHGIHVLTNYETTWYASHERLYDMVQTQRLIGEVRKVVVHDGHKGPQEIGVGPEFLIWLTDPAQNGGGAIIDFGCYGVNLMTWLMHNTLPDTVTSVTQTLKPDIYPHVDDEATIILTYPHAQAIVQGSWNWPISRKDMEVYGQTGSVHVADRQTVRYRLSQDSAEAVQTLDPLPVPLTDPFTYLAAVVRGRVTVTDTDLSALANNLIVMQILDAARESARTGQTIHLHG